MSWIKGGAHELPDKRRGGEREDGTRHYSRTFLVETDSKHDGQVVVLSAPGLPGRFDVYATESENDQEAVCLSREPRQVRGSATTWHIECRYDSKIDEQDREENPILREPTISYEGQEDQVLVNGILYNSTVGSTDMPYSGAETNAAGHVYPRETESRRRPVLPGSRIEGAFSTAKAIRHPVVGGVFQIVECGLERVSVHQSHIQPDRQPDRCV